MLLLFALAAFQTPLPLPTDLGLREHVMCWGVANVAKQSVNPSLPAAEAARLRGEADMLERTAQSYSERWARRSSLDEAAQQEVMARMEVEMAALTDENLLTIYNRCLAIYRQDD